jgi:hypothetical protein
MNDDKQFFNSSGMNQFLAQTYCTLQMVTNFVHLFLGSET